MNILYNHNKTTVDTHVFNINQGGAIDLRVGNGSERSVRITFKNGEFKEVEYDIDRDFLYTRSYWYVMGAIAQKIEELEQRYSE